jgi:hypothetical protein
VDRCTCGTVAMPGPRRQLSDGAPPRLAGAGASDDGSGFQAAEDVQEDVG